MIDLIANAWHDDGPGWWIVFVPLFWIFLIGTAVLVLRGGRWSPRRAEAPRESAIDVLDRRFAEGELSLEEYRERRAILSEQQGDG